MTTIDLKMTFTQATKVCITVLENGTPEGKREARAELMRYAGELDRLAGAGGAEFDPTDTPISD